MQVIHKKVARRRRYSIELDHDGTVIVTTPIHVSPIGLEEILYKHRLWLKKRIIEFNQHKELRLNTTNNLQNGSLMSVLGVTYQIYRKINKKIKRVKVYTFENVLVIESETVLSDSEMKPYVIKFLKAKLIAYIEMSVDHFCSASKYNLTRNRITLKTLKSKWGSCSSKGNLNFNWKLVLCPVEVLDYVIIHEVCHLKEMNHSQRFWYLVQIECPNYRVHKQWLKENGTSIQSMFI